MSETIDIPQPQQSDQLQEGLGQLYQSNWIWSGIDDINDSSRRDVSADVEFPTGEVPGMQDPQIVPGSVQLSELQDTVDALRVELERVRSSIPQVPQIPFLAQITGTSAGAYAFKERSGFLATMMDEENGIVVDDATDSLAAIPVSPASFATGQQVIMFAFDQGDSVQYVAVPVNGGIECLCLLTKDGGADGTNTTACTWTYSLFQMDGTTPINDSAGSPLTGQTYGGNRSNGSMVPATRGTYAPGGFGSPLKYLLSLDDEVPNTITRACP